MTQRRWRSTAVLCTVAMVGSLLVAAGPAEAAPLATQATDAPSAVDTEAELVSALSSGGTIELAPVTIDITSPLEIRVPGTTLVGTDDGSSVIRLVNSPRNRVVNVTTSATIDRVTITGGVNSNGSGGGINVARGAALTLVDSTVTGNTARDGGGIYNAGSLTIERSTIDNNRAERKGGGVRDDGTTTIVNSTFVANVASQGGAVSTAGTSTITHATIVRNQSTSSSSAGVDRNGGTVRVLYSIIGANTRDNGSAASDCSGTPDLIGLNLVSDASGCNPVGPVLVAGTGNVGPLNLGPLTDNGGPTATVALLDGSAALDVVTLTAEACVSGVTTDQRGSTRPFGPGCDLGAYERSQLAVDVALDADTSTYPDLDEDTVEVGLRTLAVDDILEEIVTPTSGSIEDAALRSIALRSIALRSITIEDIALRSIEPKAIALRSIALRSIALRSIALRSIALRSIELESIALRSIPLSEIPLTDQTWADFLAGTQFEGVPLQSITLEDLADAEANPLDPAAGFEPIDLSGLTLESIDLSSTALRSIALRSILLQGAALRSIPVDGYTPDANGQYTGAWCTILGDLCGDGPGQLTQAEIGDTDLLSIQLAGGSVDAVPVYDIPLSGLASTALRSIDPEDTALRSIALRSIALRSIYLENTALRSIALRSIALRSIETGRNYIGSLVNCDDFANYCSGDASNLFTLGDVPTEALIGTVADLVDLPADLIEGLSLGDLLLAFVAPEVSPWEQLDLEDLRLQNLGQPPQRTFDYVATIDVRESSADLAVTLTLPPGFAIATRSDDDPIEFDGTPLIRSNDDLGVAEFEVGSVAPGTHELRVPVRAGVVTGGPFTAVVAVEASNGAQNQNANATTDVTVVPADGVGGSTTVASLQFDDLTLAHVSSDDDADLYRFTATTAQAGSAARILLSNIPDGVDYDLAVYEPAPTPLRAGDPPARLSSVRETRYDLNPLDDVYPTDEVDDIATDVPAQFGITGYAPRDSSSRRSDADEEVRIPSLKAGTTYYVAVTSYLGASSNKPYGLRLRVDETDRLPACRAGNRTFPNAVPASPLPVPAVPNNANTLYITNTQWLAGEVGATKASEILAAAGATTGTNGVVAGIVALDTDRDVRAAYATWAEAANRCSPDARNHVVREIGEALDGIVDDDIENIVILGGDGVVPMAAVPDRTAYSNETTFARDVLTNGASNEVAGTLGAGYLLSDDPYATEAGIEINSADHELYVPTRAIGRLVEDGAQILEQLQNFVAYDGRLAPETGSGLGQATAAVTGYDFLTDGADAVAEALRAGTENVDDDLNNETWDRQDYLDLFTTRGADIISPNAHYDFESLLPAAKDGTYFDANDLATTADFAGVNDFRLPDRSVIFSMGCHAGLSVSDVQLGVTALDWAELYADGDNPWLAHTTYGYGDTEIVAYSEKLAELFAQQLVLGGDGSGSLGDAIRIAKQDYLASTLVLSPYDEKILQSFTYYGLPMYTVGGPVAGARVAQASAEPADVQSPVTFGTTIAGQGDALDRTPVTIDVPVGTTSGPANLHRVDTEEGDYFEVGGNTVTAQYRPVQPLVDAAIPQTVGTTAGFLITGLASEDINQFTPRYLRPTVDLDANERRIEPADGSFPATLQRVTTGGSGDQRLLVAAGQYEERTDAAAGRQRLFTSIRGELYEAGPGSDGVGPSFSRINGSIGEQDGVIFFEVETDATAQRVVVVYREGTSTQWRPLDLFRSTPTGNTWVGGFRPNTLAPVEFFVQAVADDGDIGISSNKVENFFTTAPFETGELDIRLRVVEPTTEVGGYYNGPVTFEIFSPAGTAGITYSVDAQPFANYDPNNPPIVSGDGGHVVFARDNTGSQQFLYFVIDGSAPMLTAERSPDVGDGNWVDGAVEVLLSAIDVGQSGVDKIEYSASGATMLPPTTVAGSQAVISVPDDGVTTVTATAFDVAGNKSAPVTIDVRIDTSGPVVTFQAPQPTPTSNGFVRGPAIVSISAVDAGVGVERIEYAINGGPVNTYTGEFAVGEGVSTILATAYDTLGNAGAVATLELDVDATAPLVDAVLPAIASVGVGTTLSYRCTDPQPGSGLPSTGPGAGLAGSGCNVLIDGVAPLTAPTFNETAQRWELLIPARTSMGTTSVSLTATDNVGNSTTVTKAVRTGWNVCPLYDPTAEKTIGSNYTIKIQLCDQNGKNVSSNRITLTALTIDGDIDPGPTFSGNSNAGYEFRFTRNDSSYTYNLNTTGLLAGIHQLYFTTESVTCPPPTPELPRGCTLAELQALATNSAEFRLK